MGLRADLRADLYADLYAGLCAGLERQTNLFGQALHINKLRTKTKSPRGDEGLMLVLRRTALLLLFWLLS